jgi:precorrin-6B methylase 2
VNSSREYVTNGEAVKVSAAADVRLKTTGYFRCINALTCRVPYRIDISSPPPGALDRLVQLGALDIEPVGDGLAAIIPDAVTPAAVAQALGVVSVTVSPAAARDDGSVWLLSPRAVRIGSVLIASPEVDAPPGALRLTDSTPFGTGHHPTTALCIEAIEDALSVAVPESILDVGTGSGVLALSALMMGVPRAVGLDIDAEALKIAAEHADLNNLADRLQLVLGGPDVVAGAWPLVVANVLAAPLIEMAPVLVRRVGSRGRLILSGIPGSVESEVRQTYQRLGMRHIRSETRAGWTVLVVQASW